MGATPVLREHLLISPLWEPGALWCPGHREKDVGSWETHGQCYRQLGSPAPPSHSRSLTVLSNFQIPANWHPHWSFSRTNHPRPCLEHSSILSAFPKAGTGAPLTDAPETRPGPSWPPPCPRPAVLQAYMITGKKGPAKKARGFWSDVAFTWNAPGTLFLAHRHPRETMKWKRKQPQQKPELRDCQASPQLPGQVSGGWARKGRTKGHRCLI